MTKFLLISEDSEKEQILREVFPMDEIAVTSDELLIFDILKVEEPDIVIVDGDEFCVWDHVKNTGLLDTDMILHDSYKEYMEE